MSLSCPLPRMLSLVAASVMSALPCAHADDLDAEQITIIGQREQRSSDGATGLSLSIFDTPQSVTQIDQDWLDKLGFDDINDVLRFATGVNVEEVETDRTYYNSRGFDIKSMQVDGVGLPFNWNVVGMLDTAMYEKVEIIRGANGLLTGTGNPSGTINYVRKRPKSAFAAEISGTLGSWNKKRLDVDISTPLSDDNVWAGRVVLAYQDGESHLDLYQHQRTMIYGIVDGQIGANTTVALGFTQQKSESDGVLWGALPLIYGNGEQTDFDVDTTTSMRWTYWHTDSQTSFIELSYALASDWQLKSVLTLNDYDEPSELFYIYANPALDADTGLGLYGWPGKYLQRAKRQLLDTTLTGQFEFGGQVHDLQIGFNIAKADQDYLRYDAPSDDPAWGALPAFPGWNGDEIARPNFGSGVIAADWKDDVKRLYAISRWRLGEAWQLIAGFNAIDIKTEGFSFGESLDSDADEISPYVGVNYYLSRQFNLYFSYSDIYEPQSEVDIKQKPLGPAVGNSFEAGFKSTWFDEKLLATFALFRAEQENYAQYAGYDQTTGLYYFNGIDVDSEGFELEASGKIGEEWRLLAGFTQVDLSDANGDDTRTFVPRKTFNVGTRYQPLSMPGLEVGGALRWQEKIHIDTGLGRIEQEDYATLSLFASQQINKNIEISVNIDNVSNEKYLSSLYWDQAFYGAPRHYSVKMEWAF